MKDTFYFSHDYNARTDPKIKKLIRVHGMQGYGIWWSIVEDLYNNANALRTDYDCIAYDLRVQCDLVKSIVNDFDLFEVNGEYFGSVSIGRRIDERDEKSRKASKSAYKRWNKDKDDANAMPTQCDSNAKKERKGKEINESNENGQDLLIQEFSKQFTLIENLARLTKTTPEKIKSFIPEFVLTLASKDRLNEDFKKQWDYFVNWYKMELKKRKESEPQKPQSGITLSNYGKK